MKLRILSDLHLEFDSFHAPHVDADVVVLAGDIHRGVDGLRWALETFADQPVVYVLGNHEFDDRDLELIYQVKLEAEGTNVTVLERDSAEISGVRFLGCTLWTDFELFGMERLVPDMQLADEMIRDFMCTTVHGKRFTAERSREKHQASRAWLKRELERQSSFPVVVITHHAPHPSSVPSQFRTDPLSAAFVSDLRPLMGRSKVWIHGHTHASFDYKVQGTRVVCNARGYPVKGAPGLHENASFDPRFVIEVTS